MLARKKIFGLPIAMVALVAIAVAAATLVGNASAAAPPAANLCPSDWTSKEIRPGFKDYIKALCYNPTKGGKHGAWLYLTDLGASKCRGSNWWCWAFAEFVTQDPEWESDRPFRSVQDEILYHSRAALWDPQKINPTHIEYQCDALNWYETIIYGCHWYR